MSKLINFAKSTFAALNIIFFTGCACLSENQVAEINRFSKNSNELGIYTSEICIAHNKLNLSRKTMIIIKGDRDKYPNELIENTLKNYSDITMSVEKIKISLQTLKNYEKLLKNLTSEKYCDKMKNQAIAYGQSIDRGMNILSGNHNSTTLDSLGACIALALKNTGTIFIWNKQMNALKTTIIKADPVINKITESIENGLKINVINANKKIKDEYKNKYEKLWQTNKNNAENIIKEHIKKWLITEKVKRAAEECVMLAKKYRKAHNKLKLMVESRQNFIKPIKEIDEMNAQIKLLNKMIAEIK